MTYTITKSLSEDFGGQWFPENLRKEFYYSTAVTTPVSSITFAHPDTILIEFAQEPTSFELEGQIDSVIAGHDHMPAVWKTSPADFPNGLVIEAFDREVRNHTILGIDYNGSNYDSGAGWVKLSYTTLPDATGLTTLTQLCIDYDQYMPPQRIYTYQVDVRANMILLPLSTLIARFQFPASNRVLDYIDISAYALTGTYSLMVVNATTGVPMATISNNSNRTYSMISFHQFDTEPTTDSVIEVFAQVTDGLGPVFVDEINVWWHPISD